MVPVSDITGKVIHKYTKNPITDFSLELLEYSPAGFLHYSERVLNTTKTDQNGEYKFKLSEMNKTYNYSVRSTYSTNCLPTNNTCKYSSVTFSINPQKFFSVINFEAEPSGIIEFFIDSSTWSSLPADTVLISSPYMTNLFIRGQNNSRFYVEPYQTHHFSWFYTKSGIESNTFSKDIFMTNEYISYTIKF
jgi:hypothetical protein